MTTGKTQTLYRQYIIEEYVHSREPFYLPVKDEVEIFEAAYRQKVPVLLKGPTGCGKTRFIEYMSWKLGQRTQTVKKRGKETGEHNGTGLPLVTIACHEDLTADRKSVV